MSFLTSLLRRGGAAPSRLSDSLGVRLKALLRCADANLKPSVVLLTIPFLVCALAAGDSELQLTKVSRSKAAAERCSLKLKSLEDFAANHPAGKKQVTTFSEEEVNSYLELDVSRRYHASLKSFSVAFEKEKICGTVVLDFDRMASPAEGALLKLMSLLFPGTHTLAARGEIVSGKGKANFRLEQAWLDGRELPKFLVEEIIATVGRKQNPPFDPLQPSQLPYKIQSIELHPGFIMVYQ